MDDDELTRLAEEELMREANVGEARAAVHGVMGWLREKTPRTNKRFLSTTISNALQHNHRQRSVGNSKETIQVHLRKEKSNHKERTGIYHSVKCTDEIKTRQCHHKRPKSQCKPSSDDGDLSDDMESDRYRSPKWKQQRLLK